MPEFMTDTEEMADLLAKIRDGCAQYGALSRERSEVFDQLCALKTALREVMERSGLSVLQMDDGATCRTRTVKRCRTLRKDPAQMAAVFQWLEENAPEMIDRSPRLPAWQTEQRYWLARLDDGEPIPECISPSEEPDLQFGGGIKFPREYQ